MTGATGETGSVRVRRRFDWLTAALGLAATGCVAIAAGSVLMPPLEEVGITMPFAVYFSGLAWWRHRGGRTSAPGADSLAALEERVAELEAGQSHVAELEERLDFAERMLTRAAEQDRIGRGG